MAGEGMAEAEILGYPDLEVEDVREREFPVVGGS
jgi:hypothetical protein